jgi:5-methylcytosine-specific restriction endonuclease McrA
VRWWAWALAAAAIWFVGGLVLTLMEERRSARKRLRIRAEEQKRAHGSECKLCAARDDFSHDCVVTPGARQTRRGRPRNWRYAGVIEDGRRSVWRCAHKHRWESDAKACAARSIHSLQYGDPSWAKKLLPGLRSLAEYREAHGLARQRPVRGWSRSVSWTLISMFDSRCFYCGTPDDSLVREHVIPLARGGRDDYTNIVPSCRACNWRKGPGLGRAPLRIRLG